MKRAVLACAAAVIAGAALYASGHAMEADGPFVWLEDIHGETALKWVTQQNATTLGKLKSDREYVADYQSLLQMLDADDRIPIGQLHGNVVLNFWQDAVHVRGIWRRTTIASYESPAPEWETVLDLDRLSADEGKKWVFKGAICSSDLSRCLLKLSPEGGDTVVLREFAPSEKRFVDGGFSLGEAKAEAAYVNPDTILFSTDFGPGTLTKAGYPRIVKLWHRGEKVSDAKPVYQAESDDVIASPHVFHSPLGSVAVVSRAVSFFETEYFVITPEGQNLRLPLPLSAELQGVMHAGAPEAQVIATLRNDWTLPGQAKVAQGSLIAFPLNAFLTTRQMPRVSVLYTPGERSTVEHVRIGRDAVYGAIYQNVTGGVREFRQQANGNWRDSDAGLPKGGSAGVVSVNEFGPEAYYSFQDFLTPTTLYANHSGGIAAIKSAPARF